MLLGMWKGTLTMKNNLASKIIKLNIQFLCISEILLLGNYPQEIKNIYICIKTGKQILILVFFFINKNGSTQMSFSRWMAKKPFQINTLEYYSAQKINGLLIHTTWMHLHRIMLSEKKKKEVHYQKLTFYIFPLKYFFNYG